jgi:hypothetical protein
MTAAQSLAQSLGTFRLAVCVAGLPGRERLGELQPAATAQLLPGGVRRSPSPDPDRAAKGSEAGQTVIDDEVLRGAGVTDFARYAVSETDGELDLDLFLGDLTPVRR